MLLFVLSLCFLWMCLFHRTESDIFLFSPQQFLRCQTSNCSLLLSLTSFCRVYNRIGSSFMVPIFDIIKKESIYLSSYLSCFTPLGHLVWCLVLRSHWLKLQLHDLIRLTLLIWTRFGIILACHFRFKQYFVWFRITDEGPIPETNIWFILLVFYDFKMVYRYWIDLNNLYLYW